MAERRQQERGRREAERGEWVQKNGKEGSGACIRWGGGALERIEEGNSCRKL